MASAGLPIASGPGIVWTVAVSVPAGTIGPAKRYLSSGQHAITSPDIKGFCVVGAPGDAVSDVEQQAFDVLRLLQKRDRDLPQGVPLIREIA